jgi:hypothetical protein
MSDRAAGQSGETDLFAREKSTHWQRAVFVVRAGTELGWGVQALGPEPSANIYDQYKYVVFKDPKWDWKTFNFDTDVERGDRPKI